MAKQKTNDNWATVVDFPRPVEEKQPESFISGLVYAVLALAFCFRRCRRLELTAVVPEQFGSVAWWI